MAQLNELIQDFKSALLAVDRVAAENILLNSDTGLAPVRLVDALVAPALEQIGDEWEQGKVALSQVYMSGRICESLVDTILPPSSPDRKGQPKMAIAVLEDHHVLGKRIIYSALRAAGFELIDLGHGLTAETLAQRAHEGNIKVLLVSVLMIRAALRVGDVAARLAALGSDTRIIVGGAPFRFDESLWQEVGATAMGKNSAEAIEIVSKVVGDVS